MLTAILYAFAAGMACFNILITFMLIKENSNDWNFFAMSFRDQCSVSGFLAMMLCFGFFVILGRSIMEDIWKWLDEQINIQGWCQLWFTDRFDNLSQEDLFLLNRHGRENLYKKKCIRNEINIFLIDLINMRNNYIWKS